MVALLLRCLCVTSRQHGAGRARVREPDDWQLVDVSRMRWRTIVPALACQAVDYFGMGSLTPVLPYHLIESAGIEDPASWTGIIASTQFAGVILACIVWGVAIDRIGPLRAIQITMAGDMVFFTASAFALRPGPLVPLRFLVGFFSPTVPVMACTPGLGAPIPDPQSRALTAHTLAFSAFCLTAHALGPCRRRHLRLSHGGWSGGQGDQPDRLRRHRRLRLRSGLKGRSALREDSAPSAALDHLKVPRSLSSLKACRGLSSSPQR